jgi:hypothetical protein
MKHHWKYLKYVLRHKWFVYQAGRKLGVGRWQLLVHGLSKFRPDEWGPYVDKFYGGPWPECNYGEARANFDDRFTQAWVDANFDEAWLRHQHRNPHHWQHWVLRNDDGTTRCLPMPLGYIREMVADWTGAGMAIHGKNDVTGWYAKNREHILLHGETRIWVDFLTGYDTAPELTHLTEA